MLSLGRSLEIVKDLGDAETVHEQYGLSEFTGTHAIGHVRMATESEVDIAGAHPYWAYPYSDVAVVHNGQLTNYFMWRRRLERAGRRFMSECDSEIIAVYLAQEMTKGATLEEAMDKSLDELDGVFTYIAVTKDELGVAKDELAAKPLVLYEIGRPRRARLRGDRDPRDRRPRDRHLRPVRARSARVAAMTPDHVRRARARGAVRGGAADRGDRRDARALRREGPDDADDQPRAPPAALRGGRRPRSRSRTPARGTRSAVGILTRCRIRFDGSSATSAAASSTARRSTSRAGSAGRPART